MSSGTGLEVVVSTRSPLLTAGIVAALRAEGADVRDVGADVAGGAIWIVDAASVRRAREAGARMLVIRDDDQSTASPVSAASVPEVSMHAELGELVAAVHRGDATSWSGPADVTDDRILDELTEREREIVGHVSDGLTNQQVATVLAISPNTVRTHLQNVMSKLAVSNRRELAALVAETR